MLSNPKAAQALGLVCDGALLLTMNLAAPVVPSDPLTPQECFYDTVPVFEGDTVPTGRWARFCFSEEHTSAGRDVISFLPGERSYALTSFLPHVVRKALQATSLGKRKYCEGEEGVGLWLMKLLHAVWSSLDTITATCCVCLTDLPTLGAASDRPWHCGDPGCVARFADGPVRHTHVLPLLRAGDGVLASLLLSMTLAAARAAACVRESHHHYYSGMRTSELDAFQPMPAFLLGNPELRGVVPWVETFPADGGAESGTPVEGHQAPVVRTSSHRYRYQRQEVHRNGEADRDKLTGLRAAQRALVSMHKLSDVAALASLQDEAALASSLQFWPEAPPDNEEGRLVATPFFRYKLLRFVIATAPRNMELVRQSPELRRLLEMHFPNCGGAPQLVALHGCGGAIHEARFAHRCGDAAPLHAVHGSALGRWHSILRHSLVPLSRTRLQTSGAAFGAGVYVAGSVSHSLYYSLSGVRSMRRIPVPLDIFDDDKLGGNFGAGASGRRRLTDAEELARLAGAAAEAAVASTSAAYLPDDIRTVVGRAAAEAAAAAVAEAVEQGTSLLEPVVVGLVAVPRTVAQPGDETVATSDGADPLPLNVQPRRSMRVATAKAPDIDGGAIPTTISVHPAGRVSGPFAAGQDSIGVQPTADDVALRYLLIFPNRWMLHRAQYRVGHVTAEELVAAIADHSGPSGAAAAPPPPPP